LRSGVEFVQKRVVFPFSAIVGMDKLKLGIVINAVNPKVGGLLIQGPKGSGKTTVVRALADILPNIRTVKDCPFNCNPDDPSNMCPLHSERYRKGEKLPVEEKEMRVIDLPLGATEDRVVGSLDVEKAIKLGVEALEPGVLAEANQNILYVDEVNLLPDHIADDLLDAAATGWNVVEREGISVSHPSRFVFVGTMNPEEGELRPQLLDRFPLSVGAERVSSFADRMEIVNRNVRFERDPEAFHEEFRAAQEELRSKIVHAREVLPKVEMPPKLLEAICKACVDLKVDGMRPDIVISKAACTLAAFEDKTAVSLDHVLVAAELALSHRTREGGFLEAATLQEIRQTFSSKAQESQAEAKPGPRLVPSEKNAKKLKGHGPYIWPFKTNKKKDEEPEKKNSNYVPQRFRKILFTLDETDSGKPYLTKKDWDLPEQARAIRDDFSPVKRDSPLTEGEPLLTKMEGRLRAPFDLNFRAKSSARSMTINAGKRAETVTSLHRGRPSGWRFPKGKPRDIHFPATIRAAALSQSFREKPADTALQITSKDIREKSRIYKAPMTIVLVIDLSKSMMDNIRSVKEAVLKLHGDAYRHRDKVGIVAMKGMTAVVAQHPITNLRVVANKLLRLHVSGFTPLAAGMLKAVEVLKEEKRRDRSTIPVMVIVTDGNANIPLLKSLQTGEVRTFDPLDAAFFKYEDLAVNDVLSVSEIARRDGIHTVVVNTNPVTVDWQYAGVLLTESIAEITGGTVHEVGWITERVQLVDEIYEAITQDERFIGQETSYRH
jgi:magnesium chelatase subunit D